MYMCVSNHRRRAERHFRHEQQSERKSDISLQRKRQYDNSIFSSSRIKNPTLEKKVGVQKKIKNRLPAKVSEALCWSVSWLTHPPASSHGVHHSDIPAGGIHKLSLQLRGSFRFARNSLICSGYFIGTKSPTSINKEQMTY